MATSIPLSSYKALIGKEVDYLDDKNQKRSGKLCGFIHKYGSIQFAVLKRKGEISGWTKVDQVLPTAILRENFHRWGVQVEETYGKSSSKPLTNLFSKDSLENSAYTFRYGENEYRKTDSHAGFKIGDQVVWKIAYDDPTWPLIGTIQMIGNSVHSRSIFVAVVSFVEVTNHLGRYVTLQNGEKNLHGNIIELEELGRLEKWTAFWTPHDPTTIRKLNSEQFERNNDIFSAPKLCTPQQDGSSFPSPKYTLEEPLINLSDDIQPQLYQNRWNTHHNPSTSDDRTIQQEQRASHLAPAIPIDRQINLDRMSSRLLLNGQPSTSKRQMESIAGAFGSTMSSNPASAKIPLKIKTLEGRTYDIEARSDWSVGRLKQEFEQWSGKPAGSCMLQYRSKRLADKENLSIYRIEPDSIIHANFRSTGGL